MGFEVGELSLCVSCIFIGDGGEGTSRWRCLAVGVELVLGVLASELQVVAVVGVYSELHDVMPGAVLVLELVIVAVHLTVVAHLEVACRELNREVLVLSAAFALAVVQTRSQVRVLPLAFVDRAGALRSTF